MHYRSAETEAARFVELAAGMPLWLTLSEWVAHLSDCGFWSSELAGASQTEREALVRRLLHQLHDHQLWPLFGHVWEGEESEREDLYRLERTFALEDYEAAVAFHAAQPGPLHRKRAEGYRVRCDRKYRTKTAGRRAGP